MTLYDKSFVEMLSVDQAALFDLHFSTVLAPIFYVEVLADLEKDDPRERTREKVVSDLAHKTPVIHTYPNVAHTTLCELELLGFPVELRHAPAVQTGEPFIHKGKVSIVTERSPESEAFERWQRQRFHDVERQFASRWRADLKSVDHAALSALVRNEMKIEDDPKNLEQALEIARKVLSKPGQHWMNLKLGYEFLGLDSKLFPAVTARWKELGHRPLTEHAPFTAHCLLVDLLFHIAVGKRLISPDRPSNKTDMAYLYYLPFCHVFVSNDKLHHRVAPLFMDREQQMVSGADLKADMIALDEHYSALPEEDRRQGMFRLAHQPPNDDRFLTSRIWRGYGHNLEPRPAAPRQPPAAVAEMRNNIDGMVARARQPGLRPARLAPGRDADQVVIRRSIPRNWGKWLIIPPEIQGAE